MKLTDLYLTPSMAAATAKLGHQVWKSTVAAGKEPRTNLGVLGLSIGQTQSVGDTSRVVPGTALGGTTPTPMLRRPFTRVPFKKPVTEEVSNVAALRLLMDLHEHMYGKPLHLSLEEDFDGDECVEEALRLARLQQKDQKAAIEVWHAYSQLVNRFPISQMEQVGAAASSIDNWKYVPQGWVKEWMEAVQLVNANYSALAGHWKATQLIADFIVTLAETPSDSEHYPFANAALKKLGLR